MFIYGFWKTAHGLWFGLKDAICLYNAEFPQPMKGAAIGGIIGGILCVIILVALIATILMVRKCKRKNKDGPPTHKPPPPMKTYSYSDRPSIDKPVSDSQLMHHETEKEDAMKDLSAYHDDKDHYEPSRFSWEDKQSPYQDDRDEDRTMGEEDGYYITSSASRGSSFMSPAVIV